MTPETKQRLEEIRERAVQTMSMCVSVTKWMNDASSDRTFLLSLIDDLTASETHTCHDQCDKPLCKAVREKDELRSRLKESCDYIEKLRECAAHDLKESIELVRYAGELRKGINTHVGYVNHCLFRSEGVGEEKTSISRLKPPVKAATALLDIPLPAAMKRGGG